MTATDHSHRPLIQAIAPVQNARLRAVLLAVLGSLALWLSAKIQVPFYPVPMTMQTFVVLLIGAIFGWRLGSATLLLYLAEGAVGLPVFAGTPEKGIGIAYMAGSTGGYLIGFVIAAGCVGWLAERGWDRSPIKAIGAMTIGTVIISAFGLAWLGQVIGWQKPVLQLGLYPFLMGDIVKIGLAAAVLPTAWRFVHKKPDRDRG